MVPGQVRSRFFFLSWSRSFFLFSFFAVPGGHENVFWFFDVSRFVVHHAPKYSFCQVTFRSSHTVPIAWGENNKKRNENNKKQQSNDRNRNRNRNERVKPEDRVSQTERCCYSKSPTGTTKILDSNTVPGIFLMLTFAKQNKTKIHTHTNIYIHTYENAPLCLEFASKTSHENARTGLARAGSKKREDEKNIKNMKEKKTKWWIAPLRLWGWHRSRVRSTDSRCRRPGRSCWGRRSSSFVAAFRP